MADLLCAFLSSDEIFCVSKVLGGCVRVSYRIKIRTKVACSSVDPSASQSLYLNVDVVVEVVDPSVPTLKAVVLRSQHLGRSTVIF